MPSARVGGTDRRVAVGHQRSPEDVEASWLGVIAVLVRRTGLRL